MLAMTKRLAGDGMMWFFLELGSCTTLGFVRYWVLLQPDEHRLMWRYLFYILSIY
jgi:hypothetical protein